MAIIDLRHLIEPEFDTVQIIGSIDKKEYNVPVKRTIGMSLTMNQYFSDYMKSKQADEAEYLTNIELNYRMVAAWMRGFYPELSVDWVKSNICDLLFTELVKILEPLFFPKTEEPGKPKKNRKKRKS